MRATPLLIASAACLLLCPGSRAEDPPRPGAAKAGPPWTAKGFSSHVAVSPDGAWLAASAVDGFRLFPAAGGDPILLDLGKDESADRDYEFSSDSKWLVVAGRADETMVPGADRTQSVLVFSVAAPSERRTYQVKLKAEQLDKDLRHRAPELANVKTIEGAVRHLVALPGSRMLIDRGSVGVEFWDAATGSRAAAPPAVEGTFTCGLSSDGARCVVATDAGLEIRDVKLNRVLQSISDPGYATLEVFAAHPIFAEDGAAVIVERRTDRDVAIDCWSLGDGKLRWSAPLGKEARTLSVSTGGGYVFVVAGSAGSSLRLLDLRDGKPVVHAFSGKSVYGARPAAGGGALWIVAGTDTLCRMELPPLPVK